MIRALVEQQQEQQTLKLVCRSIRSAREVRERFSEPATLLLAEATTPERGVRIILWSRQPMCH
jgi:hypothetical protein